MFGGDWQSPEKTAEAFRDSWCSVGDMARRDAEGYIHLVDRKSHMIISGGEHVYPSEVEGVLGAHPKVKGMCRTGTTSARRSKAWPRDIWDQHEAIPKAVAKGDGDRAEDLVRAHLIQASGFMIQRLRSQGERSAA